MLKHVARSTKIYFDIFFSFSFLSFSFFLFTACFFFNKQRAFPSFSSPAARPGPSGPLPRSSPGPPPAKRYGGGVPAVDQDQAARTCRLSTSSPSSSHSRRRRRRRRPSTRPEGLPLHISRAPKPQEPPRVPFSSQFPSPPSGGAPLPLPYSAPPG